MLRGLGHRRQIRPIVAALRRHKVAVTLIVLQVALTLAVVANALFIVDTRIVHLSRPTGTDEANLFVIQNEWMGNPDARQADAQTQADLLILRRLPGARAAFASDGYPFGERGRLARIKHQPDQTARAQLALIYLADQHAIGTFGLSLVAGRDFRADEIGSLGPYDKFAPPVCIVTRDLAAKLFPESPALGKTVYLTNDSPTVIVGVVDRLEGQYVGSTTRSIDEDTVLVPERPADPAGNVYIVRAQPGRLGSLLRAAPAALQSQNRMRLIDPDDGVITLTQARVRGYATDRGVAITMAVVCVLLLLATAGGIVGLSSFWVSQRQRQIGVRRALGATRQDIRRYFQIENFLLVGGGVTLGAVLGYAANLLLMTHYELPRLPWYAMPTGALLLWLLGQLAVHGPARQAAAVAPVHAIRG